jgi:hypothetical protein
MPSMLIFSVRRVRELVDTADQRLKVADLARRQSMKARNAELVCSILPLLV